MPPVNIKIEEAIKKIGEYVQTGNLDAIKPLVAEWKKWSDVPSLVHATWSRNALRDAVVLGHTAIVRYFIEEEGLSPYTSAPSQDDPECKMDLMNFAVKAGQLEIVQFLVGAGVSLDNDRNSNGLLRAVTENQTDIALYLLAHGATLDWMDSRKALIRAATNGNEPLVEALIAKGACVRTALDKLTDDYRSKREEKITAPEQTLQTTEDEHYDELTQTIQTVRAHLWEETLQTIEDQHYRVMRLILDYSVGMDLSEREPGLFSRRSNLSFLKGMNISGLTLIVSVDGKPVTYKQLIDAECDGADDALLALEDIAALDDEERKTALTQRVQQKLQQQCGCTNWRGTLNLVPLWKAASIGDAETVAARLAAGISPNEQGGDIPIVVAAEKRHMAVIRLLAYHPQINKQDVMTAIFTAKKNEYDGIAHYLSESVSVNTQDKEGVTLLHFAARRGGIEEVNSLLARGASVTMIDRSGHSPLFYAVKSWRDDESKAKIVKSLLHHMQDNQKYIDEEGLSALGYAIEDGAAQTVDLLLSAMKKRPEIIRSHYDAEKDKWVKIYLPWYTDFVFQALNKSRNADVLAILGKHGAGFNVKDGQGVTLLSRAVQVLPLTPDQQVQQNYQYMTMGILSIDRVFTPLHASDRQKANAKKLAKELHVLNFLLTNGADPAITDSDGSTPLHLLLLKRDLRHLGKDYKDLIETFLLAQADIEAQDKYGDTFLHIAAGKGDIAAIECLVSNGAAINAKNKRGRTPMHEAARSGFIETITALLYLGADQDSCDKDNKTALMLFSEYHDQASKTYTFKTRYQQRLFLESLENLKAKFSKAKEGTLHSELLEEMLNEPMKRFALYSNYVPELLQKATSNGEHSLQQIETIVQEVVKDVSVSVKMRQQMAAALLQINRIAHLSTPELIKFKSLPVAVKAGKQVYDLAIKNLAALEPKCNDIMLLKRKLASCTDTLAKYFSHAEDLLIYATFVDERGKWTYQVANHLKFLEFGIDKGDIDQLTADIVKISELANSRKELLGLKNPARYTAKEIAEMVFDAAFALAAEKNRELQEKDAQDKASASSGFSVVSVLGDNGLFRSQGTDEADESAVKSDHSI